MNGIKVSVIVPVYKIDEKYLRKCLQCLIDQTEIDAEFLVIDDGSPDNCGEIIDEYAKIDSRIRPVHTENFGVSNARNTGLDMASGEYIIFVDGDDYVEPDMCKKTIDAMSSAQKDILFFMFQPTIGSAESFVHDETVEEISSELLKKIYLGIISKENPLDGVSTGAPWGKVYKRSIIEENGLRFVKGLRKSQDRVFVFDYLTYTHSAALFKYVGYHYVISETSVCRKYNKDIIDILGMAGHEFEKRESAIAIEDRGKYAEALNTMYMSFLTECMCLDLFNRDNSKTFREKVNDLKYLISKEPYKSSIINGNINIITGRKRKLIIIALRCHMFGLAGRLAMTIK